MRRLITAVLLATGAGASAAQAATITVSPFRPAPGGAVIVHATGLPADHAASVRIGRGAAGRATADRAGRLDAAFVLPRPTSTRRPVSVALRSGTVRLAVAVRPSTARPGPATSVSLSSGGARAILSPTAVGPGAGPLRLRLSGLRPGSEMRVLLGRTAVARARVPRSGAVALAVAVPRRAIGAHALRVLAAPTRLAIPFRAERDEPVSAREPFAGAFPVVATAGDIACPPGQAPDPAFCQQAATANVVAGIGPDVVLALGDEQYENGTLAEFRGSYDPTWGRFKAITRPVPGNHEYGADAGAQGYFDYFGDRAGPRGAGWYSFDVGAWHVIALNSNCKKVGGCDERSPQYAWLRDDLAAHPAGCVVAMWHHALFTSSSYPGEDAPFMRPLWKLLAAGGADLVLTGHAHSYERFAPMTEDGQLDAVRGMREFVVGSGGEDHRSVFNFPRRANMEAGADVDFGVLRMELHPTSYAWRFEPAGTALFADQGSASCR